MTDVRIPELTRDAEAIESSAALAEAIEMLLAGEDKAGAKVRAPGAVAARLGGHAGVGGLPDQPVAGWIEEADAERRRRDLHLEIRCHQTQRLPVRDGKRRGRPLAVDDVRRSRQAARVLELDTHDPRSQDRDGHGGVAQRKPERRGIVSFEPRAITCHASLPGLPTTEPMAST